MSIRRGERGEYSGITRGITSWLGRQLSGEFIVGSEGPDQFRVRFCDFDGEATDGVGQGCDGFSICQRGVSQVGDGFDGVLLLF